MNLHRYRVILSAVLAAGSLSTGLAQTPPPESSTDAAAKDEAVALPAFKVSSERDISYLGREALGTTRIGVDVSDLAQSVTVLNRAFITDSSPTILAKALAYVGGVQTGTITWSVDRYLIRGFVGEGDFVDGFLTPTDKNSSLNMIDHVEVIKGPAAIFVANQNNTVGGVINKISKSPTDYRQGTITVQLGQWDTNRADLDISGPITADKKLMYRLLIAGQDSKGYFDYQYEKRTSIIPMLAYRFSPTTEAWIKYEKFDSHYSSYNGTPLDGRTNAPIAIPRTNNISGDNPNVWRTDWFNRLWGQVTTRPTDWLAIRLAGYHGRDVQRKVEATFSRRADTKQTVIDPASGTVQIVTVPGTIISSFPPGTTTPATNYPFPYTPGTLLFRDLTAVNGDVFRRDEVQNDYVFNFNTGPVSHKLLLGITVLQYPEKKKFYDSAGNNAVVSSLDPFDYASITSPANIVSVNFNQPPSQFAETENSFKKIYALDTASFLKNRVIVNWGASRSRYEFSKVTYNYNQNTGVAAAPVINSSSKLFKNLVQWGIVIKPLSNISVFYGENRNFNNNGFAGTTPNPPGLGTQKELGAKSTWLGGRLGFNVTYFDASSTNITVPAFPQGVVQNVFTAAVISRGFDGDFSFKANNNLDFIGSFAFFHAKSILAHPWDLIVQPGDGLVHSWGWMPVNNVAQNTFSLWTRYKFTDQTFKGLSVGIGVNYMSKRAMDDNGGSNVFYGYLPARTLVEASIGYTRKNLTYQVNIENLLNKEYTFSARSQLVQIPGTPVNVRGSVTYKFW